MEKFLARLWHPFGKSPHPIPASSHRAILCINTAAKFNQEKCMDIATTPCLCSESSTTFNGLQPLSTQQQAAQPFDLTPEDEDELFAAMMEVERGDFVSAEELLESLPE